MKNTIKTIALATAIMSPFASANEKLIAYCTEFSTLGAMMHQNKEKGITFDQAMLINQLTMKSNNMHNEYAMATAVLARVYSDNLTQDQIKDISYNGCAVYMADKIQPR